MHICDKCIEQAHGIVWKKQNQVMFKITKDLILKAKIRAFLDQYVIGQTKLKK
jgi:ATP-dependent Clp protease ATP-binding subunit ClpX